MRELCADYYAPVTAFLQRSSGSSSRSLTGPGGPSGREGNAIRPGNSDAAREAAHGFFEWVLTRDPFAAADPQRGRFRSYILGALKHWLANERARHLTLKRGGRVPHLPLDSSGGSSTAASGGGGSGSGSGGGGSGFATQASPGLDPPDPHALPPDREFDRQWALHVLRRALEELEKEFTRTGEIRRFTLLKPFLTGEAAHGALATLAAAEGWPESTARSHLHRLRQRFRQCVKRQITPTLSPASASPSMPGAASDFAAETADEMSILMAALTGA